MVYVARNPRDVCVSFYNHFRILDGYQGTFESFADAFVKDICGYLTPYIHHVLEFWEYSKTEQGKEHVLFLTYEEMKRNLSDVIQKLSTFLGKPVPQNQLSTLIEHLSFDKMRNNSAVNKSEVIKVPNIKYSNWMIASFKCDFLHAS